jgi:hypothetical protein
MRSRLFPLIVALLMCHFSAPAQSVDEARSGMKWKDTALHFLSR